jgi:transposase-like protein
MSKPKFKDLRPRAQQRAIVAQKVAQKLAEGVTQAEICRETGMAPNTLYRLMDDHPEVMKKIHDDVRKRATLSRHRVLTRLEDVLEQNEDLSAVLRAGKMIDERAGMTFEQADRGVSIQIFGQNVNVQDLQGSDFEELARKLGAKLGPDGERVVDAEFSVNSDPRGGEGGDEGGGPAGTPEAPPDVAAPQAD